MNLKAPTNNSQGSLIALQKLGKYFQTDWKRVKDYGVLPTLIVLVGSGLSAILMITVFYGVLAVVTEDEEAFSTTESFGLALLSTELAGVLSWVVKSNPGADSVEAKDTGTKFRYGRLEGLVNSLLIAGMAFALFGLLTPFLEVKATGQRFFPDTWAGDFSEVFTSWVAIISLIIGAVTLAIPLCLGPFLFAAEYVSTIIRRWGER